MTVLTGRLSKSTQFLQWRQRASNGAKPLQLAEVWDWTRETRGSNEGWYLIPILIYMPNLSFVTASNRHIYHQMTHSDTWNNTGHLKPWVAWIIPIQRRKKHKQESATEVLEMVIPELELTRWQCLITAATSSWMSSFFAMSSTCCRVSGRGSGLLSLTPARDSLGEVKSWKGWPRSLSKEFKWKWK